MRWSLAPPRTAGRWLWGDDSARRFLVCLGSVTLILLVSVALTPPPATDQARPSSPVGSEAAGGDPAAADRLRALSDSLAAAQRRGDMLLGEALIRLDDAERRWLNAKPAFVLSEALGRYRRLLEQIRARELAGAPVVAALVDALIDSGVTAYSSANDRISDALLLGAANCEGTSQLVASLLVDLGYTGQTFLRRYQNHLAPELVVGGRSYHFGLASHCRGRGVRLRPTELLERFRVSDGERTAHFSYPPTGASCRDPGSVYEASPPLSKLDQPLAFLTQGVEQPRGCAFPRMRWLLPSDRVLVLGSHASIALEQLSVSGSLLSAQSKNIACLERLLSQGLDQPDERLPFLAALLGHYDRGALLYAAAGQIRLVRELERRQVSVRAEALAIIRAHSAPPRRARAFRDALSTREVWPLLFVGEAGRELLSTLSGRVGSSRALAALVLHPESRERALGLAAELRVSERLELLDALPWDNPWLLVELERSPRAEPLLALKRLTERLETRWQGCRLPQLLRATDLELAAHALPGSLRTPLVLELATRRVAERCIDSELAGELRRLLGDLLPAQALKVRRELDLIATLR